MNLITLMGWGSKDGRVTNYVQGRIVEKCKADITPYHLAQDTIHTILLGVYN